MAPQRSHLSRSLFAPPLRHASIIALTFWAIALGDDPFTPQSHFSVFLLICMSPSSSHFPLISTSLSFSLRDDPLTLRPPFKLPSGEMHHIFHQQTELGTIWP